MEITRFLSLSLGLLAGVMFAIVWSKYEYYSTVYDAKSISLPVGHLQIGNHERDGLRELLQVQNRGNSPGNSSVSKAVATQKSLTYNVGGKGFYFKLDDSELGSLKNEEQIEIAKWQMFDPKFDADKLKSALSVFCVIVIGKSSIAQHGKSSFHTWTKHCNDFVMLSSTGRDEFKVKNINLPEGPTKAWERTKMAMDYAVTNHPQHDWYVKVEHNTFVVIENYRYMLLMHHANIPGFAGHVVTSNKAPGSVIALSKEATVRATARFPNCGSLYGGTEDYKELEACLKNIGIRSSTDPHDGQGVGRFQVVRVNPNLPLNAHTSFDWSWRYIDDPEKMGQDDCCRDYPISFHDLSPNGHYLMDYTVYHMRPFGIGTYVCSAHQES